MTTYPIRDSDGKIFAFEIENIYIGARKIAALLSTVGGVSDVRIRRMFSLSSEIHVEFRFQEKEFIVWEPYGDSSMYWVGPDNEVGNHVDIGDLEHLFQLYKPPTLVRLLGDLLSLKFLAIPRR